MIQYIFIRFNKVVGLLFIEVFLIKGLFNGCLFCGDHFVIVGIGVQIFGDRSILDCLLGK